MKPKCEHKYTRNIVSDNAVHYAYKRCVNCGSFVSWVPKDSIISVDMDVPYPEKDEAKQLGAFWDPHAVTWYAPNHKRTKRLRKWVIDTDVLKIYNRLEKYKETHTLCT